MRGLENLKRDECSVPVSSTGVGLCETAPYAVVSYFKGRFSMMVDSDPHRLWVTNDINEFSTLFTGLNLRGATIFYDKHPEWFVECILKPCLVVCCGKLKKIKLKPFS